MAIPQGNFWIISRKNGSALDVFDGQTKDGANVIVWPQKFNDSDNQLWAFDNGYFVNKKSGLGNTSLPTEKLPFSMPHMLTKIALPLFIIVLDISTGAFKKEKSVVQNTRKPSRQEQQFGYENGFIYSAAYPGLVLDIKGDALKDGASVILYNRKESDNLNQLWDFELHAHFEGSLNLAATDSMTHKKEAFGLPTPGYAAQVNVPPGLTSVPDRPQLRPSGTATSAMSQDDWSGQVPGLQSSHPQYQPPPPQGQGPPYATQGNYPPPPPSQGSYGSPPAQQYGRSGQSNYPPPSPPKNQDYYPPPSSSSGYGNYPPPQQQQGYQQNNYSNYPPPPQGPPQGGYSSPPNQQGAYPNPPGQQSGGYGQQQQYYSQNSYGQSQGGYPPLGY